MSIHSSANFREIEAALLAKEIYMSEPIVKLEAGDSATVPTRSPFQSTVLWGVLVGFLAAFLRKHLPPDFQSAAGDLALEICQYGVSSLMIIYGRWHAKQPLAMPGTTEKVVTMKALLPLGLCLLLASGCTATAGLFGTMPTAEHAVWREATDAAVSPTLEEHRAWAEQLATSPTATLTLPELLQMSPQQKEVWLLGRTAPLDEYRAGLEEDRVRYAPPPNTSTLPLPTTPATQPVPE